MSIYTIIGLYNSSIIELAGGHMVSKKYQLSITSCLVKLMQREKGIKRILKQYIKIAQRRFPLILNWSIIQTWSRDSMSIFRVICRAGGRDFTECTWETNRCEPVTRPITLHHSKHGNILFGFLFKSFVN